MTLQPGARIGAYEIVAAVAAGGMGEVYRARDMRLGRVVAVKVVSERHDRDGGALARLEREARAVAALSHPNIVTLHDIGSTGSGAYIVMELLDGESLDQHIVRGGLPWRRAVEIAASIADGLACAHAHGIVHRDLKPGNVFVTRQGQVKVLDFGLARGDSVSGDARPGGAVVETEPGIVFGTVAYMSPEQVRGEAVDHRSDLFSLGCALYEMLTGRRAFAGETPPEIMAAILRDDPADLAGTRDGLPPRIATLLQRCLDKQPERRFQSARDLAFALRELVSETPAHVGVDRRGSTTGTGDTRWAMAAAVSIALVAAWFLLIGRTTSPDRPGPSAVSQASAGTLPRPVVPGAVDAYLRGRRAWERRSEPDLREAIRFFQQSLDADPGYALAYAGLADAYAQLGYGSYVSPEDAFPRARAAAERALTFDPNLAEAHASLAYVQMYFDWNFAGAEKEFRLALAINPNLAIVHQWYAYLLTALERPATEAEREIATARTLDPLSVPIYIDQAYILHYYGRNHEALRAVGLALEMNPAYPPGYFWLARIHTSEGRFEEAEAALRKIGPLRNWTPAMAVLGYLYGQTGRTAEARGVLDEFEALTRTGRYASSYAIGVVHAGMGDRERALASLDAAYRERSHWLVWLKRDPRWNGIREDQRFQRLVRRVGLAP